MNKLNQLKQRVVNQFVIGLSCLGILSAVSCDNDKTKAEFKPTLQKVSFSASNAGSEESITLSDYSTVKLFITTDEEGKAPAHYYVGTTEKTFEAGGTEITIGGYALSIHLESGAGDGKAYYVHQFDLDAEGKTSYCLAKVVSFKLKDTDKSKSVPLALVENKPKVEGETTTETKEKSTTKKPKTKKVTQTTGKPVSFGLSKGTVDTDKQFFLYVQFQKPGSGKTPEYYKGTDTDISNISFKLKDENGTIYYNTRDFFEEISQGGKAADKFKITLPAEASIYENKTLIISGVSITIGGQSKTFTVSYYDDSDKKATSIQKGGKVTFIPPSTSTTTASKQTGRYVTIKDPNFRKYLKKQFPAAFNGDRMDSDASSVKSMTQMDVSNKKIESLDEIKYFIGLEDLDCGKNGLVNLNLSQNIKIESLYCNNNLLKQLDLSKNKKLMNLNCSHNQLSGVLDLSNNCDLDKGHVNVKGNKDLTSVTYADPSSEKCSGK